MMNYLDKIKDGPFIPSKLVPSMNVDGKVVKEHLVKKPKDEWTKENIVFNNLDSVLTNYVLPCETSMKV